jgi:hypothetical protein
MSDVRNQGFVTIYHNFSSYKIMEDRGQGEDREDSLEQRGETKPKIRGNSTDSKSYRETRRERLRESQKQ